MKLRLTLLAASLAFAATPSFAANQLMAGPTAFASPQQNAGLVSQLANTHGLDTSHGFAVRSEHPGIAGTKISRVDHTYKGLRVWHGESIVVSDAAGKVVSESVSERRQGLGQAGAGLRAAAKDVDTTPKLSSK